MHGHVALQLGALAEGVGAQRTSEGVLVLLVAILDVLLQGRQPFVAALAVRTREQLSEVVGSAGGQICTGQRSEKYPLKNQTTTTT